AHPLKTPSGKIEIYSSRLAEIAARWQLEKDEVISPLPVYASTFEGWDDPLRSQYPQAHPLKTPSGKIEIYSSRLAEIAARWQLEKDEV
ncbi:hypothetical protein, partial [Escherichia coli]|uniref:hypothetical protein n=1 Tax=Escherichia coli TaxID=562 RepID=UPI001596A6B3